MYAYDIIEKKRKKQTLTFDELYFFINGFLSHEISDAQMSSLLMAILLNGMTYEETKNLTIIMKNASPVVHFPFWTADKHSTGGVSDSTTLILVPICAALGVKMAKMSGRALGFTGGTIDKLEVFTGYQAQKTMKEFEEIIEKISCSVISQSPDLAVADKRLYALRNETATVDSVALIASSIMSKKLASGASYILLNVTYGSGAFMKTKKDATLLAKTMVSIGNDCQVPTQAVISKMDMPLSSGVGCTDEVLTALQALNGKPSNLLTVSKTLASVIVAKAKNWSLKNAQQEVDQVIANKQALAKLVQLVELHGGDAQLVLHPEKIKRAKMQVKVVSQKSGYVSFIDALKVAHVVNHLKQSVPDADKKLQGVNLVASFGQKVAVGELLAEIHCNIKPDDGMVEELQNAFTFQKCKPVASKVIVKMIK